MAFEHRFHHRPGGLDHILAREQRTLPGHRIAQQAGVRWIRIRLRIKEKQLALLADECLAGALDARGYGQR